MKTFHFRERKAEVNSPIPYFKNELDQKYTPKNYIQWRGKTNYSLFKKKGASEPFEPSHSK
jgi:hypothetical protein